MSSAGGSNVQKKLLDYARDYAFDQIGKKLDKARAKQQQQHMSNKHEEQGENCRIYIDKKNEVRMIERSGYQTRSEKTRYVRSDLNRVQRHRPSVSYIQVSSDESDNEDEDDSFLTAEEEDEEDFKIAREFIKKNQREKRMSRSIKSGVILNIPSSGESSDTNNGKKKFKPTVKVLEPASPASSSFYHHNQHSASPNDYSGYIQKKSLAQGMMDLALVSANTNQLRYILEYQDHHPYFGLSLAFVILSLFLQVAVGMTLLWNTRFNVKKRDEMKEADRVNNVSVIGIFMVTLINVFLSTFGGAPQNPSNLPLAVTDLSEHSEETDTSSSSSEKIVFH